mmetsp:Transcript_118871/g.210189  ORF Transcript_118871/g.210189 Transcript_118871/m.210189 type:complete len:225 (+) Transcript_118871:1515-2189(+)
MQGRQEKCNSLTGSCPCNGDHISPAHCNWPRLCLNCSGICVTHVSEHILQAFGKWCSFKLSNGIEVCGTWTLDIDLMLGSKFVRIHRPFWCSWLCQTCWLCHRHFIFSWLFLRGCTFCYLWLLELDMLCWLQSCGWSLSLLDLLFTFVDLLRLRGEALRGRAFFLDLLFSVLNLLQHLLALRNHVLSTTWEVLFRHLEFDGFWLFHCCGLGFLLHCLRCILLLT